MVQFFLCALKLTPFFLLYNCEQILPLGIEFSDVIGEKGELDETDNDNCTVEFKDSVEWILAIKDKIGSMHTTIS